MKSLDISGSALTAQKLRMEVIAQNLANANTTKTENGETYRRKLVVFSERANGTGFEKALGTALGG